MAAPLVNIRVRVSGLIISVHLDVQINNATAFFTFWAWGEIERKISSLLENGSGEL